MPICGASARSCSVANLTRADGAEFLEVAGLVPVKTETIVFPLADANEALDMLRAGRIEGAAVLVPEEDDVKYRKLGASDLEVSEISLGSWLTYGVGVEADAARACLDRAFELGVNFIDTANIYGHGAAETFLGEALADRARDSYILATKLFFPMTETRPRPLRGADRKAARCVAQAPQDRPCRSLPMPPL